MYDLNDFTSGITSAIISDATSVSDQDSLGRFYVVGDSSEGAFLMQLQSVPEPSSMVLCCIGAIGVGIVARRLKKKVVAVYRKPLRPNLRGQASYYAWLFPFSETRIACHFYCTKGATRLDGIPTISCVARKNQRNSSRSTSSTLCTAMTLCRRNDFQMNFRPTTPFKFTRCSSGKIFSTSFDVIGQIRKSAKERIPTAPASTL